MRKVFFIILLLTCLPFLNVNAQDSKDKTQVVIQGYEYMIGSINRCKNTMDYNSCFEINYFDKHYYSYEFPLADSIFNKNTINKEFLEIKNKKILKSINNGFNSAYSYARIVYVDEKSKKQSLYILYETLDNDKVGVYDTKTKKYYYISEIYKNKLIGNMIKTMKKNPYCDNTQNFLFSLFLYGHLSDENNKDLDQIYKLTRTEIAN